MSNSNLNYILITPAYNEEESLPLLIKSILKQSKKPSLWIIIDDCSNDNTKKIVIEAIKKYDWIKIISTKYKIKRIDSKLRYSKVCQIGFKCAIDTAYTLGIKYEYIGLSDADNKIDLNFFQFLLEQFTLNEKLGIASGQPIFLQNYLIPTKPLKRKNFLPGGVRIWNKKCFFSTYGYLLTGAPDTASNVLALSKGWEIKTFKEVSYYPLRNNLATIQTLLPYFEKSGFVDYHLGRSVLYAIVKTIKMLITIWPFVHSFYYFKGYLKSYLLKRERIKNDEVKLLFLKNISYDV